MSLDGETIGFGLGMKLGGPRCYPEQMLVYMQDRRIFSEIVVESGEKVGRLQESIASLHILFSTYLILLYAGLETSHCVFRYQIKQKRTYRSSTIGQSTRAKVLATCL